MCSCAGRNLHGLGLVCLRVCTSTALTLPTPPFIFISHIELQQTQLGAPMSMSGAPLRFLLISFIVLLLFVLQLFHDESRFFVH